MTQKVLILLSVFYLCIELSCAQGVLNTSGGEAIGSGGIVSFSIGQLVCETDEGSNGSLAPGVQQPYEISEITSDPNIIDITLEYKIYPNPTSDFLTLNIDNINTKKLYYFLYNSNGTLIENKEIKDNETTINMTRHVPSIFFLKIIEGQRELKTFKIIKN